MPSAWNKLRRPSASFSNPWGGLDIMTDPPPAFQKKMDELYPNALHHEEAAVAIKALLRKHGFTQETTIALVSQCRDEIAKPFTTAIDHNWGGSFNISSLAGTAFCGQTAFGAGLAHAPQDEDGNERYVVFAGPHIAIDEDGVVGNVMRRGRSKMSSACGALIAFQSELAKGQGVNTDHKQLDQEYLGLKRRLLTQLESSKSATPSLAEVTLACHDATVRDVHDIMSGLGKSASTHAVVSGILIHGPNFSHYFYPGQITVVTAEGKKLELRDSLMKCTRADYHGEMLKYLVSKSEAANMMCSLCENPLDAPPSKRRAEDISVGATPTTKGALKPEGSPVPGVPLDSPPLTRRGRPSHDEPGSSLVQPLAATTWKTREVGMVLIIGMLLGLLINVHPVLAAPPPPAPSWFSFC